MHEQEHCLAVSARVLTEGVGDSPTIQSRCPTDGKQTIPQYLPLEGSFYHSRPKMLLPCQNIRGLARAGATVGAAARSGRKLFAPERAKNNSQVGKTS